ncbi:hypothetical protein ACU8KH_04625 [Lachancea thermotolerans]
MAPTALFNLSVPLSRLGIALRNTLKIDTVRGIPCSFPKIPRMMGKQPKLSTFLLSTSTLRLQGLAFSFDKPRTIENIISPDRVTDYVNTELAEPPESEQPLLEGL